ncbi:MAG: hypothetical protein QM564_06350 [Bergeyella sp.]
MKTLKLIFLFITFLFVSSCDRSETNAQEPDVLTGVYSLREFSPGFGPLESYNPNDIIWQFMSKNTLKVTINTTIPSNSQLPYTTSTSVTYQLINDSKVTVNEITYQISISENKLILDSDSSSDGKKITFDKIEI